MKLYAGMDLPESVDCLWIEYCDGGCRGDALFYNNNLYGLASRCPKNMVDKLCENK